MLRKSLRFNWNQKQNKALLNWASKQEYCAFFDSNQLEDEFSQFSIVLAVGKKSELQINSGGAFDRLKEFREEVQDYIFGYLSYDLKNEIFDLESNNEDGLEFADLHFFQAERIIAIEGESIQFLYPTDKENQAHLDYQELLENTISKTPSPVNKAKPSSQIQSKLTEKQYIDRVDKLKKHIKRGDLYEANFCQEYFIENQEIQPLSLYRKLNKISQAPFSAFLKLSETHLICASPERFAQRRSDYLISQPIKGTAKRGKTKSEDNLLKEGLKTDLKERAENVMIVDLVRNDLSQIAKKGSVNVKELCEIYSFEQVHQMISTITAEVSESTDSVEVLKALFPMGSMTGAPKKSALKIIENLEETKRGLYSGAVGYIKPNGDFDFNVVIRSILYNSKNKYVSFSVGSAITDKSVPSKEFEECLVKAKAMKTVLL